MDYPINGVFPVNNVELSDEKSMLWLYHRLVFRLFVVYEGTETTVHTDAFFSQQDVIVNALDNVEARIYIDQRCVDTGKPLLESGTTGAKGHTQIIVPHLTESYGSQVCFPHGFINVG